MNYRIEASENSWNIAKRREAGKRAAPEKQGGVTWTTFKYFGSLEQAASKLLDIIAREKCGDATDTQTILAAIKAARAEVIKAVKAATEENHD